MTTEKEIKRVEVGAHPRGVEITKDGKTTYVTVMGSTKIAAIDLETYDVNYITNVGRSPRHLVLDKNDEYLYCSLNSSSELVKINLKTDERIKCKTKAGPRTMILSKNQNYLYVVNYFTDSFQKVDAETMKVLETVETGHHPIGITANWETSEIWVACYEGRLQVFKDSILFNENLKSEGIVTPEKEVVLHLNKFPVFKTKDYFKQKKEKLEQLALIAKANKENVIESNVTENVSCKYHLIIGSFGVESNAEKLKKSMVEKGFSAQLLPSSNGKMTMVSIQCFDSEKSALSKKTKILKDAKQSGWIYAE
jgi:YVTN family beta-propeller protein